MQKYILLDTNMFIYREDDKVIDKQVAELNKIFYDSPDYKLIIHPLTIKEAEKIKDNKKKEVFKSKLDLYKKIDKPLLAPLEFHNKLGFKNEHDKIDNELIYSLEQGCVNYFITNDKGILKKSDKCNKKAYILSIEEAIKKFKVRYNNTINTPIFIECQKLETMPLNNIFFDSLREDYKGFDKWFEKKRQNTAYSTRNFNNQITSFLMLKVEDEIEDYSDFKEILKPMRRLKIATFKVADTGKRIGETYLKIIFQEAIKNKVEEIYVTVFPKQVELIRLLNEYGFEKYTSKDTTDSNGNVNEEHVLIRSLKNINFYPYIRVDKQNIYIIPIQPKYHQLLFPEAEVNSQIRFEDYNGNFSAKNAIKKAYITGAYIKEMKRGDIILFYASMDKKSITCAGIVDVVMSDFLNADDLYNFVRKRTAYQKIEIEREWKKNKKVIMFKHYCTFDKPISYKFLNEKGILLAAPQCPQKLKDKSDLMEIINYRSRRS